MYAIGSLSFEIISGSSEPGGRVDLVRDVNLSRATGLFFRKLSRNLVDPTLNCVVEKQKGLGYLCRAGFTHTLSWFIARVQVFRQVRQWGFQTPHQAIPQALKPWLGKQMPEVPSYNLVY